MRRVFLFHFVRKTKNQFAHFFSLNENKTAHCVKKYHILSSNISIHWILCRIRLISLRSFKYMFLLYSWLLLYDICNKITNIYSFNF